MDSLKQKILNEGEVYEGNILKVDGFLITELIFRL